VVPIAAALICGWAGLAASHANPELDRVRSTIRGAREEAEKVPNIALRKPVTPADRIFANPRREEEIAMAMAELVRDARPRSRVDDFEAIYRQRKNDAATGEELRHLKKMIQKARDEEEQVEEARENLESAIAALMKLADARIARFIAPLLNEDALPIQQGRTRIPPAQELAVRALSDMALQGLIELGQPRRAPSLEETQKWWQQHVAKLGPVPAPLRKLDGPRPRH
jgi:hypothetical protein